MNKGRERKKTRSFYSGKNQLAEQKRNAMHLIFFFRLYLWIPVKREAVARIGERTKTETSQIVLIELDQT